jgi:hypothetical protein
MRSAGYNLIGNGAGCNFAQAATDRVGTPAAPIDPRLGPLADNGGPTQTHALLADSPAIDAANPAAPGSGGDACPGTDQRGVHRLEDGDGDGVPRCDIGALELAAPAAALSLAGIRPARAGNAGSATALIYGSGFATGATVELRRAGLPAIVGEPAEVSARGAIITAAFDLVGRPAGVWDLAVTNPDGSAVSLPAVFAIEEGGSARPLVEILGRLQPRVGRTTVYQVLVTNDGDVDAFGVPVMIGIPSPLAFGLRFPITPPPEHEGQPPTDWNQIPVPIEGEVTTLPLFLPVVPAGFSGVFSVALTPPPQTIGQQIVLVAGSDAPYFLPDRRPQIPSEFIAGARAYAERALGTTVPPEIEAALEQYAAEQLARVVEDGRGAWVATSGAQPQVYALSQLLIDVSQRAAALAGQRARVLPPEIGVGPHLTGRVVAAVRALLSIVPALAAGGSAAECREIGWKVIGNACVPKQCKGVPVGFKGGGDGCGGFPIGPVGSHDPNEKAGSLGVGIGHYVTGAELVPYLVLFENIESATAPAQEVVLTDQLDTSTLDLDTFSLGAMSFGDTIVTPPPGLQEFTKELDLRPAQNLLCRIETRLDSTTGLLAWRLTSLDPATRQLPEDPFLGCLPPNVTAPEGQGSVLFTVRPKGGLPTNTEIRNHATIVFDVNPPIDTPEWVNTIDSSPPQSHVLQLPPSQQDPEVRLQWVGDDAGAGLATYTVYVSANGAAFTPLVSDTTDTTATFTGRVGNTYAFCSLATDRVGNVEQKDCPPRADTSITIAAPPTPTRCVGDCNGDGAVTIEELVRGVTIALDIVPLEVCPVFDRDGNSAVTVDELVAAVNVALGGC